METTRTTEWRKVGANIQYVEISTTVIERILMDKPLVELEATLAKQEADIATFDTKKYTEGLQKSVDEMRQAILTAKEM